MLDSKNRISTHKLLWRRTLGKKFILVMTFAIHRGKQIWMWLSSVSVCTLCTVCTVCLLVTEKNLHYPYQWPFQLFSSLICWDGIFCCTWSCVMDSEPAGQQDPCVPTFTFMWLLGTHRQNSLLVHQAIHSLSHLPRPLSAHFNNFTGHILNTVKPTYCNCKIMYLLKNGTIFRISTVHAQTILTISELLLGTSAGSF